MPVTLDNQLVGVRAIEVLNRKIFDFFTIGVDKVFAHYAFREGNGLHIEVIKLYISIGGLIKVMRV